MDFSKFWPEGQNTDLRGTCVEEKLTLDTHEIRVVRVGSRTLALPPPRFSATAKEGPTEPKDTFNALLIRICISSEKSIERTMAGSIESLKLQSCSN